MTIVGILAALIALLALLSGSRKPALTFFAVSMAAFAIAYWPLAPKSAREINRTCIETEEQSSYSTACVAEVWMATMKAWDESQEAEECVFDISFFRTDLSVEESRFADQTSLHPVAVISMEWMSGHPDQLGRPAYEVIGEAIANRFPCPPK